MKRLRVEDVMTAKVVAAGEATPFKDIVRLMHEHGISGLPVLDDDERLVGIVTEADLLMVEEEPLQQTRHRFIEWFINPARLAEIEARADDLRAADIMTRSVVAIEPEMTVREAVKVLLDSGVKRLPVVDEERRVVGIVSRADLLVPFLRPDEEIAAEIRDEVIFRTMWLDPSTIDVEVEEGLVRLRGAVDRRSVKELVVELAQRVDGVVRLEDRLTYAWDDRKARLQPPASAPGWSENWVARR